MTKVASTHRELPAQAKTRKKLESELERFKRFFNLGHELKLRWIPKYVLNRQGKQLSGEVSGGTIFIYDESEEKAMETLRHEFFDYAIGQVLEPYKRVTNSLVQIINDEAYRRKEYLIERLCKLGFPYGDSMKEED